MCETWLRTNRRAIFFGCIPPLVIALVGLWTLLGYEGRWSWLRWIGGILCVGGVLAIATLIRELRTPRIAYRDGNVLFYLKSGKPIAVAAGVVEAFFLGQGPANLPAGASIQQRTKNLVARLSQRETHWARRDVKPSLGQWSDGYVTIRGTWCEPLNNEVVRRLNRRLKEVQATTTQESNAT